MKIFSTLTIVALSLLTIYSCNTICTQGNGKTSTKEVSFTNVTKLKSKGSFNVTVKQGSAFKLESTGDENIVESLLITENNGECTIDFKPGCYTDYDLTIDVTIPTISSLVLAGSGNIHVQEFSGLETIMANINGSGNIEFSSLNQLKNMELEVDGSGDIEFTKAGTSAENIRATISGSGDIEAHDVACQNAEIAINGSGNVELKVADAANIVINGSGDVDIQGNPRITQKVNGSGNVSINE